MSTLNHGGRRSLDGPVRRRPSMPVQDVPEAAPIARNPLEGADEPVSAAAPATPSEPVFVYRKPKKVRSVGMRALRWGALGVAVLVLGVGGWFGYKGFMAARNIIAHSNGVAPALAGVLDPTKLKGEGDGRVNVLVLGIGGQGHEAPNLSDTIMVMSFDPKTKDAAMLSIPRDLYVKIPATAKTGVQYGKINAANVYGGPELAARVVSNVIGVPVHYYVLIDFSGFRQAIDAVGGVDINVTTALYDPRYPCDSENGRFCPLNISAGMHHMDGATALRFARCRHNGEYGATCGSDFDRAARQQQVIAALREKALKLSTLTNPVKLTQLIDAVGTHLKTDIQPNEIKKMAALAKDIDAAKIPQKVLDTNIKDGLLIGGTNIFPPAYVEVPKAGNFNYSDIQDMVKNIFSDHYLIDENARLEVQNGSGVTGLAGTVVKSLQAAHYNVGEPVTADQLYATTVLYDYTGGKKPYTINYLEKRFKVKARKMTAPSPTVDANGAAVPVPEIRIILGSDYKPASTSE